MIFLKSVHTSISCTSTNTLLFFMNLPPPPNDFLLLIRKLFSIEDIVSHLGEIRISKYFNREIVDQI